MYLLISYNPKKILFKIEKIIIIVKKKSKIKILLNKLKSTHYQNE